MNIRALYSFIPLGIDLIRGVFSTYMAHFVQDKGGWSSNLTFSPSGTKDNNVWNTEDSYFATMIVMISGV